MIAYAQGHVTAAEAFLDKLQAAIIFPLMALMMGVATAVFLWGVFEFISNSANEKGKEDGKKHIIWGLAGLLIMISAYAIIRLAAATFGISV